MDHRRVTALLQVSVASPGLVHSSAAAGQNSKAVPTWDMPRQTLPEIPGGPMTQRDENAGNRKNPPAACALGAGLRLGFGWLPEGRVAGGSVAALAIVAPRGAWNPLALPVAATPKAR